MSTPYHVRIALSQYGTRLRAELFTEDLGDTEGDLIAAKWKLLDEWLPWLAGGGEPPPDSAREIGKQLFAKLLGGYENGTKWQEILDRAKRDDRPIRLLIDATTDNIRNLPFGLLCDPHYNYYLFRQARPSIRFVRIIRRCTPRLLGLEGKPLRILLAVAEPTDSDVREFGAMAQLRHLVQQLAASCAISLCTADGFEALDKVLPSPTAQQWESEQFAPFVKTTRDTLRRALKRGSFDILHLITHGQGGQALLLSDPAGGPDPVTGEELGKWCHGNLQMAFLQICGASNVGERGGFGGIAQQLLNPKGGDLAAVVASPYPLDAEKATPAAVAFYQALAERRDLDEAIDRGRAEADLTWAFLEVWVRPHALGQTGTRGAFQFVSPYRGLARFEERDADIFCGRDAETAELRGMLRSEPLVALVGDSGSGKSSLLRAGLAYKVRQGGLADGREWQVVTLTPGERPAANLLARLPVSEDRGDTAIEPARTAEAICESLAAACSSERPLLILFDQFEEMLTLCKDVSERNAVAEALGRTIGKGWDHLRLVLAMRSEYLSQIAMLPGLSPMISRPWLLKSPTATTIRRIIEKPAKGHGYRFQGALDDGAPEHSQSLLERLVQDPLVAAPSGGDADDPASPTAVRAPLPLLEFSLERLWLGAVERGSHEFTHEDYDRLGGLGGAVAKHAEDTFQQLAARTDLGEQPQVMMERVLGGVVSAERTSRPRRRGDLETEVGGTGDARRIIDHLVGERLLTVRAQLADSSIPVIELSHEILIHRWNRLRSWLDQDAEARAFIQEFQDDAEQWDRGTLSAPQPRQAENLPSIAKAKRYLDGLELVQVPRTEAQEAFVLELVALRAKDAEDKQHLRNALSQANAQAVELRVRNGMQAIKDGYLWGAWVWFAEALREEAGGNGHNEAHRIRLAAVQRQLPKLRHVWFHNAPSDFVTFNSDGTRMLTYHVRYGHELSSICLWDCRNGDLVAELHIDGIRSDGLAFSSDGARILAVIDGRSSPSRFQSWASSTGTPDTSFTGRDGVEVLAFDRAGDWVVTYDRESHIQVWDIGSGEVIAGPWQVPVHPASTGRVILDRNGRLIILTGWRELWIKPFDKPGAEQIIDQERDIRDIALTGDSRHLVYATYDQVTTRDLGKSDASEIALPHNGKLESFDISPDGQHVVTTVKLERDRLESRVWDIATGTPKGPPILHEEAVERWEYVPSIDRVGGAGAGAAAASVAGMRRVNPFERRTRFTPDGLGIVTASERKRSVRVWSWQSGAALIPPISHGYDRIEAVSFSPDGCLLATSAPDQTTRLWEIAIPEGDAVPIRHPNSIEDITFAPKGASFAIGSSGTSSVVWDLDSHARRFKLADMHHVQVVRFDPAGRLLAAGSRDGTARVWHVETGEPSSPGLEHRGKLKELVFSSDSRLLLTLAYKYDGDGEARVWDVTSGAPAMEPLVFEDTEVESGAFSPDGQRMLTVTGTAHRKQGGISYWDDSSREAVVWDLSTDRQCFPPLRHGDGVKHALFSLDGSEIWTYSGEEFRRWDSTSGQLLAEPTANKSYLRRYEACSPDGRRVLTQSRDYKQVQIVDAASGNPLTPQMDHPGHVHFAAFSPDARRLLTLCKNELYVWDAAAGQLLSPPVRHQEYIKLAAFNHNARHIATVAKDANTIYRWTLTEDQAPTKALILYGQVSSQHRIDSVGGFVSLEAEEFQGAWSALRERYRQALVPSGRDLLWHQQQARVTDHLGRFAHKFHSDQLITKAPNEAEPYRIRADYFERLNMNIEAIEDYSKAIELGAADPQTFKRRGELYLKTGLADRALADLSRTLNIGDMEDWHRYAIVAVLAGDRDAYRKICSDMLRRFQGMADSADSIERWNSLFYLSQSCVLAPQALDDWQPLLAALQPYMSESDETTTRVAQNARLLAGAVLCRSGQYVNALAQLNALHSANQRFTQCCLFLCLAHHALGNMDMAGQYFHEAMEMLEREIHWEELPRRTYWLSVWQQWSLLKILGREAKELVEGN